MAKLSWSKYDTVITLALFGGTVGAAGWILGAALELTAAPVQPAGILLDIVVVLLCAVGVMLTGVFIWGLYLSGRRLSGLFMMESLLGTSLVFGIVAVGWLHARGVLALAVAGHGGHGQPGNEIWEALGRHAPPELAYAAPLILLGMMAAIWWPPFRKRMFGADTHIQRGTPEGERPWHLAILPGLSPVPHISSDQPHPGAWPETNRDRRRQSD
jgi:hypothetical protein